MTDRLSQLMHDEAGGLVPPPPDAAAVLVAGRSIRQRRRVTGALVATVAAVVVTSVGVGVLGSSDPDARDVGPASPDVATAAPTAYGVGSEIHLGDAVARVPDTVHSLHYTSLGVLVRSNPHGGASDGSGPESLTLVRPDGSTTDLGTVPEGVGPATDPGRDVYVLAQARGDGFEAVVRDVATGRVLTTVPLPDLPPSYWDVPPLALDGSSLYVGYRNETAVVDLDSGEVSTARGLSGGLPTVGGGRAVGGGPERLTVVDALSGEVELAVDVERQSFPYGTLSPDGRFFSLVNQDFTSGSEDVTQVYDVASGEVHELPGSFGWGWTTDGDLFRVEGSTLTRCEADTGECRDTALSTPLGKRDEVRLGGVTYES